MTKKYYLLQNIHDKTFANILKDQLVWDSDEKSALKFDTKQDIFDTIEKYNFPLIDVNIVDKDEPIYEDINAKEDTNLKKEESIEVKEKTKENPVEKPNEELHPERYGGDTPYECKKVLQEWYANNDKINGYEGFLLSTIVKYCNRFGKKDDKLKEAKKIEVYGKFLREYEEKK